MPRIEIEVGPEAFRFDSEQQWVNKARSWFRSAGLRSEVALCVDARGRACLVGADFMRATREGAYPIVVYPLRAGMAARGSAAGTGEG